METNKEKPHSWKRTTNAKERKSLETEKSQPGKNVQNGQSRITLSAMIDVTLG